jgi:hypothetical protein
MTILSNLYVEKVNAEHPLAIWLLNDKLDFISYLTEDQQQFRNASSWNIDNATVSNVTLFPPDTPIPDANLELFEGDVPTNSTVTVEAKSLFQFTTEDFSQDLGSVSMAFHLNLSTPFATQVKFGYRYTDPITLVNTERFEVEDLTQVPSNTWRFFANTFDIPPINVVDAELVVQVIMGSGGGAGDYNFFINGLSFAPWSEEFHKSSVGVVFRDLPSDIALPSSIKCVPALPYAPSDQNAFYLGCGECSFAINFGIPLVYGSTNVTKLTPNILSEDFPSLIFPGYGFLNESGRNNVYTAEMWLRINTDARSPRRFFGPIGSKDGLYVEGGFITLVIGDNFDSHYVGEWFRPMLVHIRVQRDGASVLLNGEEVISLNYLTNDITFPNEINEEGKSQNWLGFYSYDDVKPLSIDSFAIYSYAVANEVAKRRYVWGQGVVPPEQTNSSLNAVTAFNDFAFANYTSNYNYPDFANWNQAFFSNVDTTSNYLTLPDYELPDFYLGDKDEKRWYSDLQTLQEGDPKKYFTFRPNSDWDNDRCYFYFPSIGFLSDPLRTIYGVFETDGNSDNETLFKIENKVTFDHFKIVIDNSTVTYSLQIDGESSVLATRNIDTSDIFAVGLNVSNLSASNIDGINKLFGNPDQLKMFMAGDLNSTFSGKVYRIGMDGPYNNRKIKHLYNSSGIFEENEESAQELFDHVANYTLRPFEQYGIFFADISVSGYWEDYIPLSYFAKTTTDFEGNLFYDLDSIQINLDYPEALEVSSIEFISSWIYRDLKIRYSTPVQLSYQILDNNFYTGWDDYEDMAQDSNKFYYYDTMGAGVRSYVSFQEIESGANTNLVDLPDREVPRVRGVVDPSIQLSDWETAAYEVVDSTVVYPPKVDKHNKPVDFNNLALVYHLDIQSQGIIHHPFRLRKLQLASQVLERNGFTEVGTKFGTPVFPYSKLGLYFDFKAKNPLSTYKQSTPYLYMTRNSGWRVRGDFSPILDRGLSIPINTQRGIDTQISALQLWLRFSDRVFPTQEIPIFSIEHRDGIFDFLVKTDPSTQRGSIVARDRATNQILQDIRYFVNGQSVDVPYLINEEWAVLGIAFPNLIDFNQFTGRLNLNGPVIYNNVSYYLATNLAKQQSVLTRAWAKVQNDGEELTWQYWKDNFNFGEMKVISTGEVFDIDPIDIYEKSVGTNRIVFDDVSDGVLFDPELISVYTGIDWSTRTQTPV